MRTYEDVDAEIMQLVRTFRTFVLPLEGGWGG